MDSAFHSVLPSTLGEYRLAISHFTCFRFSTYSPHMQICIVSYIFLSYTIGSYQNNKTLKTLIAYILIFYSIKNLTSYIIPINSYNIKKLHIFTL